MEKTRRDKRVRIMKSTLPDREGFLLDKMEQLLV